MAQVIGMLAHHAAHWGIADLLDMFVSMLDIDIAASSAAGDMKRAKAIAELAETLANAKEAFTVRMNAR
jgi:hypothetical protein